MNLLYTSLSITSVAMAGILALAFFEERMKKLLKANFYYNAFSLFAIVAVIGILLTSGIGFSTKHQPVGKQVKLSISKTHKLTHKKTGPFREALQST